MKNNNEIMIQPYMVCELSKIYKISEKTLRNWLDRIQPELGERYGRYYTAKQVEIIFKTFGVPYKIEISSVSTLCILN